MNVHSHVNVRNEESATVRLQFLAFIEAIDTAKHDRASPDHFMVRLPPIGHRNHEGLPVYRFDGPRRHNHLGRVLLSVPFGRTDQPVQVRFIDVVAVEEAELANAEVCQLLHNVGSAGAEADDSRSSGRQNLAAVRTEKLLPTESIVHLGSKSSASARR